MQTFRAAFARSGRNNTREIQASSSFPSARCFSQDEVSSVRNLSISRCMSLKTALEARGRGGRLIAGSLTSDQREWKEGRKIAREEERGNGYVSALMTTLIIRLFGQGLKR